MASDASLRKVCVQWLSSTLLVALVAFTLIPGTGWEIAGAPLTSEPPAKNGPYVHKMILKVIYPSEEYVAALVSGAIDHIPGYIWLSDMARIENNPDIEVTKVESFASSCLFINCARYPFSIVSFRRALAFAMDKQAAATAMWGDLGYPVDNVVPRSCGVWHNNATYPNYLAPNVEAAKAELAAGGFGDVDGDGYVEAPDGSNFVFRILYYMDPPGYLGILNACRGYWDAAGIPVRPEPISGCQLGDILYHYPHDYDGALFGSGLSYNYNQLQVLNYLRIWTWEEIYPWDGVANNVLNWVNASYEDCVETAFTTSDYDTLVEKTHEAQQILVENVPLIPICGRYLVNAHRTDRLEGWLVAPGLGTSFENYLTPRRVRLRPGQPGRDASGMGGVYTVLSPNSVVTTPRYGFFYEWGFVLSQIYQSLLGDPNPYSHQVTDCSGGFGYDWTITPLVDKLQIDFTVYGNATWHDGIPVTAEDVEFTYNYRKSRFYPYLNACVALDDTHVRITTNTRSLWHLLSLCHEPILPKHVWEGIVDPWYGNPQPIGFGPFKWHGYTDDYRQIELEAWELYHLRALTPHTPGLYNSPLAYCIEIGIVVIVATLVGSVWYLRRQPRPKTLWNEAA